MIAPYKAGKKASCPVLSGRAVKSAVYPFLFLGILHLLNFLLEKPSNSVLFIYEIKENLCNLFTEIK